MCSCYIPNNPPLNILQMKCNNLKITGLSVVSLVTVLSSLFLVFIYFDNGKFCPDMGSSKS